MKSVLVVLPLLVSIPLGALGFAQNPGVLTAAPSQYLPSHHAPSAPVSPVDVAEGEEDSSHPCGMPNCVNMVGCTAAGTAVAANSTSVLASTFHAPDDLPLILEFQTATRTAVPPPPRA